MRSLLFHLLCFAVLVISVPFFFLSLVPLRIPWRAVQVAPGLSGHGYEDHQQYMLGFGGAVTCCNQGTESLNLESETSEGHSINQTYVGLVGAMFSKRLGRSHNRRSIA